MPIRTIVALAAVIATTAFAAEMAPPDRNAACMDRTVDASSGDCVIKDDGTPRHTYPPKHAPVQQQPKSSGTTVSPTVRGAVSGK